MATKKVSYPKATSPRGVFLYPHLQTADTKFKAEGEYSVKVRFDPADVMSIRETEAKLAKEKLAQVLAEKDAKWLKLNKDKIEIVQRFKPETDDEGEETGQVIANFGMKAEVTKKDGTKFTQRPGVFDAKGKPTKAEPWSGSEGKVRFEYFPYFNEKDKEVGVSFRMIGVQIIKLVTGGEKDAAAMGFGEEEGFEDEADETSTEIKADGASDSSDDSDF